MNKYYTPDIEEFCVGFECEGLYTDWGSQNWSGIEINDIAKLVEVTQGFDKNPYDEFRVKYLDDSDIEELGFKLFNEYELMKTFKSINTNAGIVLWEGGKIVISSEIYDSANCVFEGKVKNKSELVKLLKMLEIN